MTEFDNLRTDESILSLINLCRDISAVNQQLVLKCAEYERIFQSILRFDENVLKIVDDFEFRIQKLENNTGINRESFPELRK